MTMFSNNSPFLIFLFSLYAILIISSIIITLRKEVKSTPIALWIVVIFWIPIFGSIINLCYYIFFHQKTKR